MKTTKSFIKYIDLYGPHFTKALCDYAIGLMENESGKIKPITKQEILEKMQMYGIQLQYNQLDDFVYVANMCKADFWGKSVPADDQHLCQYIKDVIDDPDGYDGQVFYRWLSDIEHTNTVIDWSSFV